MSCVEARSLESLRVERTTEGLVATKPLEDFLREDRKLIGFVVFLGGLIEGSDKARRAVSQALLDLARTPERREKYEADLRQGDVARETMQANYAQMLTRMTLQHGVDNFLTYVTELLRLIFSTTPEALRSSETVAVEDVLRHPTIDELVRFLVERKVDRLSYQSMRDLSGDLDRTLGFPLVESTDIQRGIRHVPQVLGIYDVEDLAFVTELAITTDRRAAEKFHLPRKQIDGPHDDDPSTTIH